MIQIPRDFLDFIHLLNKHDAAYVIVGGYAVATHGYVRYTGDIDFFIALNPENAEKLSQVFRDFGFRAEDVPPEVFLAPGKIIRIGAEPMRLEIMNRIDGVGFGECFDSRLEVCVNGENVNFIGLDCLLKNKLATGRGKDKVDADELLKIDGDRRNHT